jgi:hypothetical protein
MEATLEPTIDVGEGPLGHRAIANVTGGWVEGPRIKAKVLPSGADWFILKPEQGLINIDVRALMETDDGAHIYAHYLGRIAYPPEMAADLFGMTERGQVDASRYYFRTAPLYETGSQKYAWLNRIQAIGVGEVIPGGVAYEIYEIK